MRMFRSLSKTVLVLQATLLAIANPAFSATLAGKTPGEFSVSSGGSANYRIPIQVVPGTAGMEPKLNIVYDSQQDNGMLGVGWSLSGLSSISRCPKVRVSDGQSAGVGYVQSDRYCLGGQRLMLVSGTHGTAGAQYRSERDNFSLITAYGSAGNGPAYFIEKTKAGLTIEYGNTTDSRVEAQGQSTARAWAQNKISDTKGNYLSIAYNKDSTTGSYYPSRLDYTGNAAAGVTPAASVQLGYESRADTETAYQAGSMVKLDKRLNSLKTYNGTTLVRNYQFSYEQSTHTNRSRLKTLTECDGSGNCLSPVSMSWPTVGTTLTQPSGITLPANIEYTFAQSPELAHVADFNGDGKMDYMWKVNNNGWWIAYGTDTGFTTPVKVFPEYLGGSTNYSTTPTWDSWTGTTTNAPYLYFADFNGDGKTDIMWRPNPTQGWLIAYSTGTGFTTPTMAIPPATSGPNGAYTWAREAALAQVADFNGDGKMDYMWKADNNGWWVVYGTDTGFTTPVQALPEYVNGYQTLPTSDFQELISPVNRYYMFFADFNGDGKVDLLWRPYNGRSQGWLISYSTGNGFTKPTEFTLPANIEYTFAQSPELAQVADFNGDGKMDYMWKVNNNGWWIAYGTDTGFTTPVKVLPEYLGGSTNYSTTPTWDSWTGTPTNAPYLYFADFNGDGKTDIMWRPSPTQGWLLAYSTGTGFTTPTRAIPSDTGGATGAYTWAREAALTQIADFNGDGKMDYMWKDYNNGWWVVYGTATGFTPAVRALPEYVNGYQTLPTSDFQELISPVNRYYMFFADFNGDGKVDLLWRPYNGRSQGWLLAPTPLGNDTISTITGSGGDVTTVTYKPISNAGVYTKDSGANAAVYPAQDIIGPFHVVSSVDSSNGVGGVITTNYSYGGLKVERNTGVGLLGFRWIKSLNTSTQLENYSEMRQDWPYLGWASKSETRLSGAGNAGVLKRSTQSLSCKIPLNGAACTIVQRCDQSANASSCAAAAANRYFVYVASSVEEGWDLNGAAWPSYTTTNTYGVDSVDAHLYGDLTQSVISASDGSSKTTVLEYWPADTANWTLGRLKQSTVTSVTP